MRPLVAVLAWLLLAGCEIGEVTVAEPTSSIIAEVYLRVDDGIPDGVALLHRTAGAQRTRLEGAVIEVEGPGSERGLFTERPLFHCLEGEAPEATDPICFRLEGPDLAPVRPGARLSLRVQLTEGERLEGVVTMPGNFALVDPPRTFGGVCSLASRTVLPLRWTQSEGAWAYVPETEISGLRAAFQGAGFEIPSDPLTLLGLSVSQSDTTIAFPSEFGVFNRFSGDRDVLVALQGGLPPGDVTGRVVISAQERNAVNWSRGGIFNPSGQVRVPSLFGDGTGVVGGVVNRSFAFRVDAGVGFPPCG